MQTLSQALTDFDQLPDSALVGTQVVERIFSAHRSTIWRWVKAGKFPAPKKFGSQTCRWSVGDLRRAMSPELPPCEREWEGA